MAKSIKLVALVTHLGYGYKGPSGLVVHAGETFSTDEDRAARVIHKGLAALSTDEVAIAAAAGEPAPEIEAAKVDKRSKAFRDAQKKHKGGKKR